MTIDMWRVATKIGNDVRINGRQRMETKVAASQQTVAERGKNKKEGGGDEQGFTSRYRKSCGWQQTSYVK